MRNPDRPTLRSSTFKMMALFGLLALVGIATRAQASCTTGRDFFLIYYSDATLSHEIGRCVAGPCPGQGCTGQQSRFVKTVPGGPSCLLC